MQEPSDAQANVPIESLQLVNDLLDAGNFRDRIPTALRAFSTFAGADSMFFLEFAPNRLNELEFYYHRILKIDATHQEELQVPKNLVERAFELAPMLHGLLQVAAASSESQQPTGSFPTFIQADSPDDPCFNALKQEPTCWEVLSLLEIECKSFLLLPLVHQARMWGMIFCCARTPHSWQPNNRYLGETLAKLLGRLIAGEYWAGRALVKEKIDESKSASFYPANKFMPSLSDIASNISEQEFIQILVTTYPDCLLVIDIEHNQVVFSSKEEFAGHNLLEEASPMELFGRIIHPDQRQESFNNFFHRYRQAKDDEILASEYRILHKDGHWIWMQERVRVFQRFPDGQVKQYLSVMIDITERKESSIRLQESQERYQNFIKYSVEGIFYLNCGVPISLNLPVEEQQKMYFNNTFIEECNDVIAKKLVGISSEDLVGRKLADMIEFSGSIFDQRGFKAFAEQRYQARDLESKIKDDSGQWRYYINHFIGIIEDDHLIGIWGVQRDITAVREAEEALQETERRLTSFVDDAHLGIWEWNWEQDRISVNEILLEILGLSSREPTFNKLQFVALIAKEDRDVLHNAMQYHLDQGTENYQVDIRMGASTEEMRWVQLHGRMVEKMEDGTPKRLIGSLINIHENKVSELLLAKGQALLHAVVHAIPDTKFRVSKKGEIRAVYTTDEEQTNPGLRRSQVLGKRLEEVFPIPVAKGLEFNAMRALEGASLQTFEFVDNSLGDGQRFYEARLNAINAEEYILILRDISAVKKSEQALTEQIHEVDRKNRQLEAYINSNLQLENFAYIASHDLREPARTMRTFSQFLKKRAGDQLDEDSNMYLDFIISGANRMNQLIQDLLTYSRVNTEPFEREDIQLPELLAEVQDNLKSSIAEKEAVVQYKNLPGQIQGSTTRLQQLFQNLISNAIKFHRPNVPPKVKISAKDLKTHWQFTVADNGIGIDPEFQDQVFVIFKKLHNNQTYQGTGIGLALVKRIVTQHEGEIWLDSALDKGTRIHFTLKKS